MRAESPTIKDHAPDHAPEAMSPLPSAEESPGQVAAQIIAEMQQAREVMERRRRYASWGAALCLVITAPFVYWATNPKLTLPAATPPGAASAETDSLPAGATKDPVRDDLTHYLTVDLPTVAPYERAALEAYAGTTGDGYISDKKSAEVIRGSVLPEYKAYLSRVRAIHPATPEVQALHKEFLSVADNRYATFEQIGLHAGQGSDQWKKTVTGILRNVKASDARYQSLLNDLQSKHLSRAGGAGPGTSDSFRSPEASSAGTVSPELTR